MIVRKGERPHDFSFLGGQTMAKKLFSLLLAVMLPLSCAACSGVIESDKEFQKNMNQSDYYRLNRVCETEDGYYLLYGGDEAYFIDKETKQAALLCTKPECAHDDDTCNARIYGGVLWETGGRLYYTNSALLQEKGKLTDYGERIYSVALDGTDQRVVQELEFEPSGSSTYVDPILHRGYVYFVYSGVLYRVKLGEELEKAEELWGDTIEKEKGNIYHSIPVGNNFTLWADGDFVYVMCNVRQADGTYKDTLFAYDAEGEGEEGEERVKQVWQTPDADTVGEWTETGVSVTKWYVKDGFIYFYLSGGDYWRCDLETDAYEKLADTHEKTPYGKAIFSDEALCLLNAVPEDRSLPGFEIAEGSRYDYLHLVGGDTFYVYDLETVCLLSKLNVKQHIEVELTMDEMDLTAAEKKASYEEIKAYVLEKFGIKVSHLYIAQVKRKCGIIERENYNKPKSEDSRQPKCPPEKEAAIREALKHFRMIG